MKNPENMTKRQLVEIVQHVRDLLWLEDRSLEHIRNKFGDKFADRIHKTKDTLIFFHEYYDPNKEWDCPELASNISELLANAGLRPNQPEPLSVGYPKRTSNQMWKDDSIQFPRLLDELAAIGVENFIHEAGWRSIEDSTALSREQIMKIFSRAQKEWDRVKKELKDV